MSIARLRWMTKHDIADAITLEAMSFDDIWAEESFKLCMKATKAVCLVAENEFEDLAGYLIYKADNNKATILRMAIHPLYQGRGVGTMLLEKVTDKRHQTKILLREHNLNAQLFFKNRGFRLIKVRHGHFGDEDGYIMGYLNTSPKLVS